MKNPFKFGTVVDGAFLQTERKNYKQHFDAAP